MGVLVFMIHIALFLGITSLCAFIWVLRAGRYNNIAGAEYRVLLDD